MSFKLDYEQMIFLDSESLAETGIGEAYELLLPELRKYVSEPAQVQELIDNSTPSYAVTCGARKYRIYGPEVDDDHGDSWGKATVAFFTIVNDQLVNSEYRFYAISGGNDLGGMFLTPAEALAAREVLPDKKDWPYIPENGPPWYGRHH